MTSAPADDRDGRGALTPPARPTGPTGPTGPRDTILVTRPAGSGAERLAEALAARGWRPVLAPVTEIVPLQPRPPCPAPDAAALVVTSAQAVAALLPAPPPLVRRVPVFAVGPATAAAVTAAGWSADPVMCGAGTAAELVPLILARIEPEVLGRAGVLHATGLPHRPELAQRLADTGVPCHSWVLYHARPVAALPVAAAQALTQGRVAAITVLSPAAAHSLERLVAQAGVQGTLRASAALVLSQAVAQALDRSAWACLRIAPRPDLEALLSIVPAPPAPPATGGSGGEPGRFA